MSIPIPNESALKHDRSWITTHVVAVLIVLGIVGGAVTGAVYFVDNLEQKHAAQVAQLYSSLTASQAAQTQQLETQLKTDESNWATIQSRLLSQNATLSQTIASQDASLAAQTKANASLNPSQIASNLVSSAHLSPQDVTPQPNGVTLSTPSAQLVLTDVETVPVLKSDLANTQQQLMNETTIATNTEADLSEQKKLVSTQQNELATDQKTCDARVAAEKANTKKAGLKGFVIGVGVALAGILGHSL